MLIDENKDYVTKSKLTVTVKTPTEYNEGTRVAAKQTDSETQKTDKHFHREIKGHTYR